MPSKFKVGDRVVIIRLNKRTPIYIREAVRLDRSRTITDIYYDETKQHNNYHMGSNKQGEDIGVYAFRADQLRKATHHVGRPREKRKYKRRVV